MLPTIPGADKSYQNEILPSAGEYWRFKGDLDENGEYHAKPVPDHGLVLLVSEVRYVDAEIHTVVLNSHPTWGEYKLKVLADNFLTEWSLEAEWQAVRDAEMSEVQERINGITRSIQAGPEEETLKLLIEQQREKREAADDKAASKAAETNAIVPAALLPSGDVLATQKKIESGLDLANAQAAFIQGKTNEIQSEMKLLVRFQTEKTAQALASVSSVQNQAKTLLDNVRTMRLFLGEDSETHTLVSGQGASKEEPLTLMQRLLYLDEEIFIEGQFDEGFDHGSMHDLDKIFQNHPQIIERMMPYERCVVLARVRRHNRPIHPEAEMKVSEMFALMQEQELDKRVFLFIRDGENVHMVVADEQTSRAQRLFPSKSEIDDIFTTGFRGEREITVKDIEYSYARERHDDRALHYKRFLLLLWGLHEREGLLGDFLPKGQNWLTESVHNERFRFIHDEENVLDDGRMSLSDFMKSCNANMTDGSRIAVDWNEAMDSESAPQVYEDRYRKVDPINNFEVVSVKSADGGKLVAKCLSENRYSNSKPRNVTVRISSLKSGRTMEINGRTERPYSPQTAYGVFCLDHADLADIDYYINSRAARVQYLNYIHLFAAARKLLAAEKSTVDAVIRNLLNANPNATQYMIKDAVVLWRKAKNWALPETAAHMKAIQKIVTAMIQSRDLQRPELLELQVNAKGEIIEIEPVDLGLIKGFDFGFVKARTLRVGAKGKTTEISCKTVLRGLTSPGKSSIEVWCRDEASRYAYPSEIPSVRRNLASEDAAEELAYKAKRLDLYAEASTFAIGEGDLSEVFGDIDHHTAELLMHQFYDYVYSDTHSLVPWDNIYVPLGMMVLPTENENRAEGSTIYQIGVMTSLSARLWSKGHADVVKKHLSRIYKPEGYKRRIGILEQKAEEAGKLSITLCPLSDEIMNETAEFCYNKSMLNADTILESGLDYAVAKHITEGRDSFWRKKEITEEDVAATQARLLSMENLSEAAANILKTEIN